MKDKPAAIYTDFCDELIVNAHTDDTLSYVVSHYEQCKITHIEVLEEKNILEKEIGDYITIEYSNIHTYQNRKEIITCTVEKINQLFSKINKDINKVLVVGLGNKGVVSDALGPKCSEQILVTAHLYANGDTVDLEGTRDVATMVPGVMGQTGLESALMIQSICKMYKPDVVIAIDALATSSLARINRAIQINNVGIKPGGGVSNHRLELHENTLHTPIIAIGVATVTSVGTIIKEALKGDNKEEILCSVHDVIDINVIVTPKNMDDELVSLVSIISESINKVVHPNYDSL